MSCADCEAEAAALNLIHGSGGSDVTWLACPRDLHVLPGSSLDNANGGQSRTFQIKWRPPASSAQHVEGFKLTVTALDDAGRSSFCAMIDLTNASWTGSSTERELSYGFTFPGLGDVFNWHVQVQNLPTGASSSECLDGSATAFVNTYTADASTSASSVVNSLVIMATIPTKGQAVVDVIISPRETSEVMTYYIFLYKSLPSDLFFSDRINLTLPDTQGTFRNVTPATYQVWATDDPMRRDPSRTAKSPLFTIPAEHSQELATIPPSAVSKPPATKTTFETSTTTASTIHGKELSLPNSHFPPAVVTAEFADNSTTRDLATTMNEYHGERVPDDGERWEVIVPTLLAVVASVTLSVVVFVVCYWRRRKRSSGKITGIEQPCMEKLNEDSQRASSGQRPHHVSTSKPHATPPIVTLCLLSYSTLKEQTHVTDSLALYLQAVCACDVTYFRWHLDEVRSVGPAVWLRQQTEKAHRIVFVHTPDTYSCYKAWKLGQSDVMCDEDKDKMTESLLHAAFDLLHDSHEVETRWMDVTFFSENFVCGFRRRQLSNNSDSGLLRAENSDMKDWPQETGPVRTPGYDARSQKMSPPSSGVYRLMDDFSQFVADLHAVNNNALDLMNHQLPTEFDHLDTEEGMQLSRAIASLRFTKEVALRQGPCLGKPTAERNHLDKTGMRRFDSGYDEEPISFMAPDDMFTEVASLGSRYHGTAFIGPDEISAIGTDVSSLGDRFRAINARYELMNAAPEADSASYSDCYSLGARYV
ncbi:hypothetical protein BaRGS_00009140 [Batillaria attramentaria]|uniref:SEFIR domain-containing protein n=1 Tax=Batillaria attramentaria TaxID=370345 RepID=A0ABD0LK51_9CAEN